MKKLLLTLCLTVASNFVGNAQIVITLPATGFTQPGGTFTPVYAGGEAIGTLTAVGFNTTLTASTAETYANDLAIYVTPTATLAVGGLLQVGGYSNFQAAEKGSLTSGASDAVGTTCSETYTLITPIVFDATTTQTIWLGNGYSGTGAAGSWTGTVTLTGLNENLGVVEITTPVMTIYPNPAVDVITISSVNEVLTNVQVSDMNGRIVRSLEVNNSDVQVNVSDLATGVYVVNVTSDKGTKTQKFVKQ